MPAQLDAQSEAQLGRFHASLTTAELDGNLLQPAPCDVIDGPPRGKLFVRESYFELWDIIMTGDSNSNYVITGTPGIGNSLFAIYMLHKLRKQGHTVLYHAGERVFVFSDDGVKYFLRPPSDVFCDRHFTTFNTWFCATRQEVRCRDTCSKGEPLHSCPLIRLVSKAC